MASSGLRLLKAVWFWIVGTAVDDTVFRDLRYRFNTWTGSVAIKEFSPDPIEVIFYCGYVADLSPYRNRLLEVAGAASGIRSRIVDESFLVYRMNIEEAVLDGRLDEANSREPFVSESPATLWNHLKVFEIELRPGARHDVVLRCEVDWRNPHYLGVYLQNLTVAEVEVEG